MKTVFITGGSRGIGAEAVRTFKNKGYNVAFTYYKSGEQALCLAKETGALAVFCDVSNSEAVNSAIDVVKESFGSVDILINNAGIDEFSLFTDITDEMWHRMIDTNLSSAFYTSRAVLPDMINKKDGVIINISSMWGEVGASCEVHYSVSKAGLIGLTKALAKEVGPSGIRVNCITPGVIDTDMNKTLSEEDIEQLKLDTPLGKIGKTQDIVNAILFLADNSSHFITGQVLGVNGGYII
ncbi:MAG: SDR family oxidoreductase [Ruminococcaceae bacterium]|nr:SDR family oxidoreductase [Oscillospiraceae bacterium]